MSEKQNTEEQIHEQAKILKEKGIHELNNNNLKDALKYFSESYELKHDSSTEAYIHKCRKLINKEKLREEAAKTPDVEESPKDNQNTTQSPNLDQDKECQDVIDKKDYYEILGIAKEADENEIKRAYKKLAIRFHPDKNQSKLAEDAFKKISHAFQTLKDPEKKAIYDKYGSEEEIRERYAQQNHYSHYEEDDVDPFDLFEMFFSNNFGNVNYQRARQARRQRQEEYYREQQGNLRNSPRYNRNALLVQLLPLFLLMLFSVIPYLFQTKPYYQFEQTEDYHQKMTTAENKIDYFVGERFMNKYQTWEQIHDLEFYIERDYLAHLGHKCGNTLRLKNELEHKLSYYRNTAYRGMIKNELENLDMNSCRDYYKYKNLVR